MRRKTEKEKVENNWRRKIYSLLRRKKNEAGKEGKYIFCGGEEKRRRKRWKIIGEGKYILC